MSEGEPNSCQNLSVPPISHSNTKAEPGGREALAHLCRSLICTSCRTPGVVAERRPQLQHRHHSLGFLHGVNELQRVRLGADIQSALSCCTDLCQRQVPWLRCPLPAQAPQAPREARQQAPRQPLRPEADAVATTGAARAVLRADA